MSPIPQAACSLVVLTLDKEKWAFLASAVERVVRAVEITRCPDAPAGMLGLINVQGNVVPVFSLRQRAGLPERPLALSDQIVIARTEKRLVAFVADEVAAVMDPANSALLHGAEIPSEAASFDGILKLKGEIILIYDLDRFLSNEQEHQLAQALEAT